MRALRDFEKKLIEAVADRLSDKDGFLLKSDMESASAVDCTDDSSRVSFVLKGYDPPLYKGQHQFPVEIRLLDADGSELTAILYGDGNGRLFELEIIRWDGRRVISPNVRTMNLY